MKYVERMAGCQPDWRRLVDRVMACLLPTYCVLCGMACGQSGICRACRAGLPWNTRACPACALPVAGDGEGACGACLQDPPVQQRTRSPLVYEFPVRQLVQRYKFQRDLATGRVLAEILAEHVAVSDGGLPEYLVPVPLHGFRLFARGFNQAYDLARHVGRRTGVPVVVHGLRRTRHTRSQAGLDAADRRRNLRGALAWRQPNLAGRHVALVDDVMTTGTTVRECARVLRQAGAGRVDAWVVARAVKRP